MPNCLRSLWTSLLLLVPALVSSATTDEQIQAVYRSLIPEVRFERVRQTYTNVTDFGSRISGTQGEARTFDYVEKEFKRLGLSGIERKPFDVTVPDPEARGTLHFGGQDVTVYPLWPNLVRTSTCDVTGPVVYGGDGSLEAFRGKDISGSIVLLEFESMSRWRNAAKLGAKAIIFIEAPDVPRGDAEQKFSSVPIDVPRFYVRLADVGPVLNAARKGAVVSLKCRQDWVVRQSALLTAELPGSDPSARDEKIVLMAYADSMSVVPGLAPGAEAIGSVAGLLESARIWSKRDHRRPLRFVLAGAHHLSLRGARQFVANELNKVGGPEPLTLTLTLDLASGSPSLGSFARSWYIEGRDEPQDAQRQISRVFRAHAARLAPVVGATHPRLVLVDAINNGDSRTWRNNIPGKFALDSDPISNSGYASVTFATTEDSRPRVDTPADTLEHVKIANVVRQIKTVTAMLYHVLNDTSAQNETSDFRVPLRPRTPSRMSLIGGFGLVEGRVVSFDPQQSFLPDTPIPNAVAALLGRNKTMMGVRGDLIQLTGKDAKYAFEGIPPVSTYYNDIRETRLAAFSLDNETGDIRAAATYGFFGGGSYPTDFMLTSGQRISPIVVFPCVAINLFDLVDPMDLRAMLRVRILDARSGAWPQDFGIFSPSLDMRMNAEVEDVQVLFTMPGQQFQLLGGSSYGDNRLILTGSAPGDPAGQGYKAPGEPEISVPIVEKHKFMERSLSARQGTFQDIPLNAARDILAINDSRIEKFTKYRIVSPGVLELQSQAREELRLAEAAKAVKDWPAAERHARAAWGYALRAHPVLQKTGNDVVNGVVFYLFLLIPFSYFAERLLVGNRLLTKQLAVGSGIFLASFLFLRLIHPAFEIVTNPTMIFVGFMMGALSIIVILFILGKFESSLRSIRREQSGLHEVDIRRSSVALAAFNLGVNNMRRRKARTFLTTLTLVVMTFIVLSFTSIVSELQLNEYPSDTPARYSGILLRNPGLDPMQSTTFRQVANEFEGKGTVVRRTYYYGADIGDAGVLTLQRADRVAEVRAMLGLDPGEANVARIQEALLPGGRFFKPGDRDVILLPTPIAENLKVSASDVGKATVNYGGVDYLVIGIVDPSILRGIQDLDGDGILPPDFSLSRRFQEEGGSSAQAFRSYLRLDPGSCFILPAETALNLGSDIRTIGVSFPDATATRESLKKLMPRIRLNLYASVPKAEGSKELQVRQFSVFQANKGTGLALVLVQLAIAAIFVLNTMVASVYERTKEIAIFSSIGLAPNHIAMLFFAESLVYGVLGAVAGYFLAQLSAKIIVATNTLQGLYLNFSSTSAVLSAVLVMAVVLGSTIYPARKASQIAAPAMNDEVLNSEPEGDEWSLELPFSVSTNEAAPVIAFLSQWLRAYEEYTIGDFVTSNTKTFSPEEGKYSVQTTMWLAPYDLGISHLMTLTAVPGNAPGVYALELQLHRLGGDPENWPVVSRRFLGNLRKQFLTWRTIDAEQRASYREKADGAFEVL